MKLPVACVTCVTCCVTLACALAGAAALGCGVTLATIATRTKIVSSFHHNPVLIFPSILFEYGLVWNGDCILVLLIHLVKSGFTQFLDSRKLKCIMKFEMVNWLSYLAFGIDVSLIALFIYSILLFFKRTRSYTVFIGLVIAVGLYGLAKYLDLKLTLLALKYFVSISVVVFVVVFQTELRKYFELLGLIGARQIRANKFAIKSPEMNEVYRACVEMADSKFGALVVVKGRDDIDQFIEGGMPLDGIITEETILSIFFPNSAGHDGAVIIANNRVSKFGTHLPLSVNFKEIGKHGTRHAAAIGMSENTDALCIVVSEEKGTISVCRDGKMKTLDDPQNLEKELDKFTKAKLEATSGGVFAHIFRHNLWAKAAAILLALAFWFINR